MKVTILRHASTAALAAMAALAGASVPPLPYTFMIEGPRPLPRRRHWFRDADVSGLFRSGSGGHKPPLDAMTAGGPPPGKRARRRHRHRI